MMLSVVLFLLLGNGLLIASGCQYDRVYCGARCPLTQLAYLKQLLKVGSPPATHNTPQ